MKEKIIDYIRKNRVSSTEVADALGKTGAVDGVFSLNSGHFCVGEIKWIYAANGTNWDVHEQIQNLEPGKIVFVECFNCDNKAIFGDLVSKYILLYKQSIACVVTGKLRDIPHLKKENWPIWCTGVTPIGCLNKQVEKFPKEILWKHKEKYDGAIAVCDDSGVVIIPKDKICQDFYERLEFIEAQEDKWFECIDQKKWSTFDTICLKKYLSPNEK